MRLSLKDLFGITAFCAAIGWCASQVGFDNGLFWIVMAVATLMTAFFVALAKDPTGRRFSPLAGLPLLLCCMLPFFSLALVANALLLFGAGVYCACRLDTLSIRTLSIMAMIAILATAIAGVLPGIYEVRELSALRREYPVVDLDRRLAYERRGEESPRVVTSLVLNPVVASRLNKVENEMGTGNMRRVQFEQLHNSQYELFVRAIGFGVGRMMRPRPEYLRRPPLTDIPFGERHLAVDDSNRSTWWAFHYAERFNDTRQLHDISRVDFLDMDGFGALLRPGRRTAGFMEHGFHYPPVAGFKNPERWSLERLELVSLLKFEEPRVYVLDHLPRMDQLSGEDVPTRSLDAFETGALDKIWTDQDVVIERVDDRYRMIGSLRAAKQCLDCHAAERGELLGAFSYVLTRVGGDGG